MALQLTSAKRMTSEKLPSGSGSDAIGSSVKVLRIAHGAAYRLSASAAARSAVRCKRWLDGSVSIGNLRDRVVRNAASATNPVDLFIRTGAEARESQHGITAIGHRQRERHHDRLVRVGPRGCYQGKSAV